MLFFLHFLIIGAQLISGNQHQVFLFSPVFRSEMVSNASKYSLSKEPILFSDFKSAGDMKFIEAFGNIF